MQEQYKRFYYRDVQAVVVTRVPRFVVTPLMAVLAITWALVLIVSARVQNWSGWGWLLLALAAGAWLYISLRESCVCRLYTAVSREELPSIYRMWTARKAIAEIERRVSEVQGVFTENWAEAADLRALGPTLPDAEQGRENRRGPVRSRTWISDIFLVSLLADAAITWYLLERTSVWLSNLSLALTVVQIAAAIGIFVERYRRTLRAGMQRLAVVALVFIGGITYAQMIGDAMEQAMAQRRGPVFVRARARAGIVRPIYSGGAALLAIAGFVLSFKPE